MTVLQGRRSKQLMDNLQKRRGCWKMKEEAVARTQWENRFGRGSGPGARQTTE